MSVDIDKKDLEAMVLAISNGDKVKIMLTLSLIQNHLLNIEFRLRSTKRVAHGPFPHFIVPSDKGIMELVRLTKKHQQFLATKNAQYPSPKSAFHWNIRDLLVDLSMHNQICAGCDSVCEIKICDICGHRLIQSKCPLMPHKINPNELRLVVGAQYNLIPINKPRINN